jgi:lysophospholipase
MQLFSTPDNRIPDGAVCVPVKTRDGLVLRAMRVPVAKPKGTVVVLGGRGDFIERYFETTRDLMQRGYCVASLDVRGQGGSPRLLRSRYRGHLRNFADHDEDLRAFMTEVVLPDCPPPYYAIGHSTGGHILLRSLRSRTWFSKAILAAPLIGIIYGSWPLPLVRLLVFLTTRLGFGWMFLPGQGRRPLASGDFAGNPLTSDQRRWNRDSAILEAAPELGLGGPTFSWLRAAMASTATLKAMGPGDRLRAPVLTVAAGLDQVVDNEAIRGFARRVPGVSLVFIREAMHEILTESDDVRAQFLAAFEAFIEGKGVP